VGPVQLGGKGEMPERPEETTCNKACGQRDVVESLMEV
jgi:hypothetical protein